MRLIKNNLSNIFILYYIFFSLFSYYFLSDYFSYGDVSRYLQGEGVRGNNIVASTVISDYYYSTLVNNFGTFGTYFINLTLTSILLKQLFKVIPRYAAFFFLFPGVIVWISAPSKESIIFQVMALTTILGSSILSNSIKLICLYLLVVFKPTLGIFAILFYIALYFTNGSRSDYVKLLIIFFLIFAAIWGYFFYFYEQIDFLFTQIGYHFSIFANTNVNFPTRELYSFVNNIPEGAIRLLFTAYPSEAFSISVFTSYVFIESFFIFLLLCFALTKSFFEYPNSKALIILICFISLVVVYYPFAFYNIGSAWRYKTSFLIYFLLFLLNFIKKDLVK